jgi:hypothetical protein
MIRTTLYLLILLGFAACLEGCSQGQQEENVTPRGLPTPRLQVQPVDAGLLLSWSWFSYDFNPGNREGEPEAFVLYLKTPTSTGFEAIDTLPGTTAAYSLSGLTNGQSYALYLQAEAAHAVPSRSQAVMAQPGAARDLTLYRASEQIRTWGSWAPSGQAMVYMRRSLPASGSNTQGESWEIVLLDLPSGLETVMGPGAAPAWHPGGEAIVYQSRWFETQAPDSAGQNQLKLYRLATDQAEVLSDSLPGARFAPAWSPDGSRLAYFSNEQNPAAYQITLRAYEGGLFSNIINLGAGIPDPGASFGLPQRPGPLSWASDGSRLFFDQPQEKNGVYLRDIYVLESGNQAGSPFLSSNWNDVFPTPAPDGNGLAFLSDRSGRTSLWRYDFASGALRQIALNPAFRLPLTRNRLAWSPDGQRLSLTVIDSLDRETVAVVVM